MSGRTVRQAFQQGANSWRAYTGNVPLSFWCSALFTLLAIYSVQYLSFRLVISQSVSPDAWKQPFQHLPAFIYVNWDGGHYRHLYQVYNEYQWPPLYPFTLRLLALVFGFSGDSFAKSALLLNFISHAVIVVTIAMYVKREPQLLGASDWLIASLILFYPGHNVFFAAYSESFYLAVSLLAIVLYQRGAITSASLFAGASALIRTMGTFLVVALVGAEIIQCIRDRELRLRRLLSVLPGVAVVVAWNLVLSRLGTNTLQANASWTEELLRVHIHGTHEPRFWVLEYLSVGPHWEVVAFWAGVAALIYCAIKQRFVEACYIAAFYCSLAVYVYRPFPWSRFVSILFPVQIMVADLMKRKPRGSAFLLAIVILVCIGVQIRLFSGNAGEP